MARSSRSSSETRAAADSAIAECLRQGNQLPALLLRRLVVGLEERPRSGRQRGPVGVDPERLDDAVREEGAGRRRDARNEIRTAHLRRQGDALVELAFGRDEALGDPVDLVQARLHPILEPEGERKEVPIDPIERDRTRFGHLAHERLELLELRVAFLPGGTLRAVDRPGALVRLARHQPGEVLDLLGRRRVLLLGKRPRQVDHGDPVGAVRRRENVIRAARQAEGQRDRER